MSESIARYQQRRLALQQAAAQPKLVLLPPADSLPSLQLKQADLAYINAPQASERFMPSLDAANADVTAQSLALLEELEASYDAKRFDTMVADLRSTVIHTVAGAFGVGKLVSAFDRNGGNVDTVHNARNGVYASDDEQERYAQRGSYDKDAVHKNEKYRKANAALAAQRDAGTLTDAYSNQRFDPASKHDAQLKPSLDHTVAAVNVHNDAGRVLAELRTEDLANIPENLAPTSNSANSMKKQHRAEQVAQRLAREAPQRKARLAELEARKDALTLKERKEYKKLTVQDTIDPALLANKERQAQEAITEEINKTYYTSGKFVKSATISAAGEGAKMGLQQALGLALVEFLAAAMDEVRDLYRGNRQQDSLLSEAGMRLRRIADRVSAKWKPMLLGLRDGFISGLLSSIVTTLINTMVTTGARLVRIIREGLLSLLRAVRLLWMRPKGMTRRQAMHEASKILVGALMLTAGIALEELISKQLAAIGLVFIADAAGAAIAAVITAVCTGFAVYMLDKADLFSANRLERAESIGAALDLRLQAAIADLKTGT
ncbi:hypothetical protein [Massilia oculi]|uniref:hypothetical protein n=1 Tax=Massilia oculi TaxID=945844 RepID=UPI0028AEEC35|nr:hypothetical protein [Massilia oculi]